MSNGVYRRPQRRTSVSVVDVKHLNTGNEYPNSPCGSGDHKNFVYRLAEVTCPACKKALISNAQWVLETIKGVR